MKSPEKTGESPKNIDKETSDDSPFLRRERVNLDEIKTTEGEERKLNAVISKDATFADLFGAIDAIEKEHGTGALNFEEYLWDNFDDDIGEEIFSFQNRQANKAKTTKILDFFRERNYSEEAILALLPIKFK